MNHPREFRKIQAESEFFAAALCTSIAYPGAKKYAEDKQRQMATEMQERAERDKAVQYWGLFEINPAVSRKQIGLKRADATPTGKDKATSTLVLPAEGLVGTLTHISFDVTLFGDTCKVGGLGFVSADLLHKKQGIAKSIVLHFLSECNKAGQGLAALHPFRGDFYAKMGWGFSTPYHLLCLKPSWFPKTLRGAKESSLDASSALAYLTKDDAEAVHDCFARFAAKTHGCFHKPSHSIKSTFWKDKGETQHLGYFDAEGTLRGFISYKFQSVEGGSFLINDMEITLMVYETVDALAGLCRFLHTQEDQFRRVLLQTQDFEFFRTFLDTRNAELPERLYGANYMSRHHGTVTLCLMYRIVNMHTLFESTFKNRNFNNVSSLKLKILLDDNFTPERNQPILLSFTNGKVSVLKSNGQEIQDNEFDVVLSTDIANFSSVVVGASNLKNQIRLGQATVDPESKEGIVQEAFRTEEQPVTFSFF